MLILLGHLWQFHDEKTVPESKTPTPFASIGSGFVSESTAISGETKPKLRMAWNDFPGFRIRQTSFRIKKLNHPHCFTGVHPEKFICTKYTACPKHLGKPLLHVLCGAIPDFPATKQRFKSGVSRNGDRAKFNSHAGAKFFNKGSFTHPSVSYDAKVLKPRLAVKPGKKLSEAPFMKNIPRIDLPDSRFRQKPPHLPERQFQKVLKCKSFFHSDPCLSP
nr:hypothetical protein [Ferrovum myxofaciens]